MAEERQEEFNPFASIDLNSLQEMGDMIPDETPPLEDNITPPEEDPNKLEQEQQLEQEQEPEESQQEETESTPPSENTEDSSLYTPYAKLLKEGGITPNLDLENFDGTPDSLLKAVQDEIQLGIDSYKEHNLDPRVKWLQDNLEQGVPLQQLLDVDAQATRLETITPEAVEGDESLQKDVVRQYYKETTQFSDEAINKAIERLEATGDLAEESKGFLDGLKGINAQKQQQLQAQAEQARQDAVKAQEQALVDLKQSIDTSEEIIQGLPMNSVMKDKLYKSITTPVDTHPQTGAPLNKLGKYMMDNPQQGELIMNAIFEYTNGFSDWSAFKGAGKKAAFNELEAAARRLDSRAGTKQTINKPAGDENLANEIANMFPTPQGRY
jgi:hypothetical protein